jgi:YggT family protein
MLRLLEFINYVLTLYIYVIIIVAIMSWLVAFNIINMRNNFVSSIYYGLNALTEPLLRPIRRVLPDLGGIDISPVILILIIVFIQSVVIGNLADYFASQPAPTL